jgi:hypothetical protein
MVERRRANRVSVAAPATGALRVLQDVVVGHVAAGEITVASAAPVARGEHMRLEVARELGPPWSVVVRTQGSWAEIEGDRVGRCVRLHPVRGTGSVAGDDQDAAVTELASAASAAAVRGRPLFGSLIRRIPVRLLNLSFSGCLFESPLAVGEGTVGFVEVTIQDRRRTEAIRIRRLERRAGRVWPYRNGGEFLTFTATGPASLRGVAAIFSADETSASQATDSFPTR